MHDARDPVKNTVSPGRSSHESPLPARMICIEKVYKVRRRSEDTFLLAPKLCVVLVILYQCQFEFQGEVLTHALESRRPVHVYVTTFTK